MRSHIKFEVCAVFCAYLFLVSMVNAIVTADKREERKVKRFGISVSSGDETHTAMYLRKPLKRLVMRLRRIFKFIGEADTLSFLSSLFSLLSSLKHHKKERYAVSCISLKTKHFKTTLCTPQAPSHL